MRSFSSALLTVLFSGSFFCCSCFLSAQIGEKSFKDFFSSYNNFSRAYTQEKVYLHFDNNSYFIGETIWFKAYVLLAESHHYSPMSKTLYVELLNSRGDVLHRQKLKIENGQCNSGFFLSGDWYADYYEVRAYTRCMLNFGEAVVFSRVFPVMDPISYNKKTGEPDPPSMSFSKSDLPVKRIELKPQRNLNLDFYPEGGHLIDSLPAIVAFKATGRKGEDALISGNLFNSRKEVVSIFSSMHQGMGYFEFIPEPGQEYTAKVLYEGREQDFELPDALPWGYTLRINNQNPDFLAVNIAARPQEAGDSIGLALTCRGKIYARAVLQAKSEQVFQIPKQALPSGVQQITLFNRKGEILAERLVFVRNPVYDPQQYNITVKQLNEHLDAFRPVRLEVQVEAIDSSLKKDSTKNLLPAGGPLVLSVRDASENLKNAPLIDIYSDLLLASELKGYIHNPAWYFEKEDLRRNRALDLLMLIQGWKRYDWEIMTGSKTFEATHPIEEGILLQGKILSQLFKKPKEDILVTIWMTSDSTAYYGNCLTDSLGAFNFLFDFTDTWNLSLQIKDGEKRKNHRIILDRLFSPVPGVISYYEQDAPVYERLRFPKNTGSNALLNAIDSSKITVLPGEVLLPQAEIKRRRTDQLSTGEASVVYTVEKELDVIRDQAEDEYSSIPIFLTQINPYFWMGQKYNSNTDSMEEIMQYKGKEVVFILEDLYSIGMNSEEMPYVDEVENIAIVESQSPNLLHETIEAVASMKSRVYVHIYRYKDRHRNIDPLGIRKTTLQGYSRAKEFFHPKYDRVLMSDPQDHRRTLYWNPELKTDSTGKALVRFYNSATCKKMSFDAVLLTEDGKMGLLKP
ncbi:MAG: hypothetical protein WCZ67_01515 [Bacteroidales bacterium]